MASLPLRPTLSSSVEHPSGPVKTQTPRTDLAYNKGPEYVVTQCAMLERELNAAKARIAELEAGLGSPPEMSALHLLAEKPGS